MTRFARANDGARIAWRAEGNGEPLLLISGQAVDSTSWNAVIPDFGSHHRVIVFDHRGTGESDPGDDTRYTTRWFADDARAVLDAAGTESAHVYGHSMGGRVAQWLAIDHPSRVGALVLGATTAGDARGVPRSDEATADLLSGDPDRLVRLFFRSQQPRVDAVAFFDQTASRHAKRLHRAASQDHDLWDRLGEITSPTLIIHGADDELTPPGNAEQMAAAILGSELDLRPTARHGYFLEDPRATATVIAFLQRHPLSDVIDEDAH